MAHLTAQYLNKDDVDQALDMFEQAKVSGVLPCVATASTVPNRQEYSNMPAIWPYTSASNVRT